MKYVIASEKDGADMRFGKVIPWNKGVVFRCPCNERQVYIASPPHDITFDDHGLLTLNPSVGSKEKAGWDRPKNWCHFWIKSGTPEMCTDAGCPGAKLLD